MADDQKKYSEFRDQARLPKFAIPKRYVLRLKPDLNAGKCTGTVKISVDVIAKTKFIVLNAANLSVDKSTVQFEFQNGSKVLPALKVELFEDDEILVLEFANNLPIGVGILSLGFESSLLNEMKGFYTSSYEHDGKKKKMGVTQFQAADARRCFPCWDEPTYKATFKITLVDVPSELITLSNMPVSQKKSSGSDLKTVSFEESPIMSTYLVAIVIGLFDYLEDRTPDGTKVRVYCPVGKASQGKFALDLSVKALDFYKSYFGAPYSLPKLDMVAIPDFAYGGMENYGLVTYREAALLYDDNDSSAANKKKVAIIVAHELAHQWFGNLVTMEWWTDLWLNEGFATWVAYLALDSLYPDWNVWTQFLSDNNEGLQLDGLSESHPIQVEVKHARNASENFDAITYKKGAYVIRMLESYLGHKTFQRALASYIKRYACSNAKTEDLWAVLEQESGEPVSKIMNSWTKQKGYPVLSAKLNDKKLELEQSHLLSNGSMGDGQWVVPITLCRGSYDTRKNFLLQTKSEAFDTQKYGDSSISRGKKGKSVKVDSAWIKVNVNQAGFYRVKYDDELSARLSNAIESKSLSEADRYGVLDDSYALCMGCQISLTSLLTLMAAYREELDYSVLASLINMSFKIERIVADAAPKLLDNIKLFFINLFKYSAGKLGWDPKQGESHSDAMLRGEILTALVQFGHDETLNEASKRFRAFMDDRKTSLLPPDLRKAVYIAVMQKVTMKNRSALDSLLRFYKETDLSEEKNRILGSLGSCRDPGIILEVLNFLLTSEVRKQDIVIGLAVSREGHEMAWKWLKDNWEDLLKTLGSGGLMARLLSTILSPFSSYEKAKEVKEFFASRVKPSFERTLRQNIEWIQINANWVKSIQKEKQLTKAVEELAYNNELKKSPSLASAGSFKKAPRKGFLRKLTRYVLMTATGQKPGETTGQKPGMRISKRFISNKNINCFYCK